MYIGRFAPTTSGPLHLGSLLTAVASYLDAKAHNGSWLLRFDNIDVPRNSPHSVDIVLKTLEAHHLHWDGMISYQTDHQEFYDEAINDLHQQGLLFYCTCTRSELRNKPIYPGKCRSQHHKPSHLASTRVRVDNRIIQFNDHIQGMTGGSISEIVGDFNVRRKEGIISYPLAVVVDDQQTGVSNIVRGSDLLENTLAQLFLIKVLGYEKPQFAHIPVINQRDQIKLSKRDKAIAIDNRFAHLNLSTSLQLLGLNPPLDVDIGSMLNWAIDQWDTDVVPKQLHFDRFISV